MLRNFYPQFFPAQDARHPAKASPPRISAPRQRLTGLTGRLFCMLALLMCFVLGPVEMAHAQSDLGTNGDVNAILEDGNYIYVGGSFTSAGSVSVSNIARWDKTSMTWSALGTGVNGTVNALAKFGTDIYAGGSFTNAGGASVLNIAKVNPATGAWTRLTNRDANGPDGPVKALEVFGGSLYIGGAFTETKAFPNLGSRNVVKWSGSAFSAFGAGIGSGSVNGASGPVNALKAVSGTLYVGGSFSQVGTGSGSDLTVSNIATWNGSAWSVIGSGSGTSGPVNALAANGSDIYVGGTFTTADGVSVNNIAKLNGTTWSALGLGTGGTVNAVAVNGSEIFAAGTFATAGGNSSNNIAKWDGTVWSPLVGGTNNSVKALISSGSRLYAGGAFTIADGLVAPHIAIWNGSAWAGFVPLDAVGSSTLEGNSVTPLQLGFQVSLDAPSVNPVEVNYATSDGSALAGSDYTSTSGTLTIAAGETTGTIFVPILGDMINEPDETFTLTLSSPRGAIFRNGNSTFSVTGTIRNDDAVPVLIASGVTQAEGNSGSSNFEFKVSLSAPSNSVVTVSYATSDGSASSGSDYTATSGTLTIPAGSTSGVIPVQVSGDTETESDENFSLTLSSPVGAGFTAGAATQVASGNIVNDDADVTAAATDVSSLVTIYKSGLSRNRVTGRYVMSLVIQNKNTALDGPLYVALDGLNSNISMYNPDGVTLRALPAGSPYRKLILPGVSASKPDGFLGASAVLSVSLEVVNPTGASLTFTPRLLQGPGTP